MNTAHPPQIVGQQPRLENGIGNVQSIVSPSEFRSLLISHRRLVRIDRHQDHLRGLHDLDSGETFFTDGRRILQFFR